MLQPAPRFDPIEPFNHGMLQVSDIHQVYYEQVGNPNGVPVLFLHGGPGAGCTPKHRTLFDPEKFRAVLFDQRGCGRSQPRDELSQNTTRELVKDIEKLRQHLGIESWIVAGGSWGSTLALAYAQEYPAHVMGMVLRSIFLGSSQESAWIFSSKGAGRFFPEEHKKLMDLLTDDEQKSFKESLFQHVKDESLNVEDQTSLTVLDWEYKISVMEEERLAGEAAMDEPVEVDHAFAHTHTLLELHYATNHFFLASEQLLSNIARIEHIPCFIIHGRYDLVCPINSAWRLHKKWPKSKLIVDPAAGHTGGDLNGYVVAALNDYAKRAKRC